MGVINMAHGELMMIGAYATYVVQSLFRSHLPGAFDWYLVAAIPVAFAVRALVGMVLERSVIRWLYGRPLETLLATWGISLMLIQAVRTIFGAQNVEVENPTWLSGGVELAERTWCCPGTASSSSLFALVVLAAVWLLINRTRLGLFVRGVTQNRPMARLRRRADRARRHADAFGLGSGIAGLGRLRAVADRQRRARPRPELHRRLVHGGGAGRRRPARRHRLSRRSGSGRR